jgi:hypothetical protein
MLRGNDTQVYQYDFDVPAPAAFYQTNGNIYWLSVESCNTHLGLFGWKTCILSDRFGDDAVWTWLLPPSWGAMVYPPGHPYVGQSMDMSFLLGTVPVADPAGPHGAILQSAPEITGPWTDVSGAASPYLLPTDKPRCFYRVYVP